MKELLQSQKKCLANMPMLLDTMSTSIEHLDNVLTPVYDEIEELLEECLPSKYRYTYYPKKIYLFGDSDNYKPKYLEEAIPFAKIHYYLEMKQNVKRSPRKLVIQFGYLCDRNDDTEQNIIYFHLSDESDKPFLGDELLDELKKDIPEEWILIEEDRCIEIQFDVDETLSVEKITRCADDFKKYILQPVCENLK